MGLKVFTLFSFSLFKFKHKSPMHTTENVNENSRRGVALRQIHCTSGSLADRPQEPGRIEILPVAKSLWNSSVFFICQGTKGESMGFQS